MRVKLSDDTYEYIKQQVVDMFQEYEIQCVPISAFEIASKLKIPVIPYSALPADKREASMKMECCGLFIIMTVQQFNTDGRITRLCTKLVTIIWDISDVMRK